MEDKMSTIADKVAARVGAAVKARREGLGLTLRALAAQSGVSASMISDIERGAKSPTITTLAVLADALGVPVALLVEPAAPASGRIRVVRGAERPTVIDPVNGACRESFGPAVAGSRIEFLRYTVQPHTIAGPFAAHPRGTIEHVHLASGALRIVLGDEEVRLAAGDSCSCHADATHLFDNADGDAAALLYLVSEGG
jgi:transcriptional regulator with XRE-family HTH domain